MSFSSSNNRTVHVQSRDFSELVELVVATLDHSGSDYTGNNCINSIQYK